MASSLRSGAGVLLLGGAALVGFAGQASANTVAIEFTEHELGANYNGTSFTATGNGSSFAEVSRLVAALGAADFLSPPGMSANGGGGMGGFTLALSVTGSGTTRTGTGTFQCADVSGADLISGTVNGTWSYFSGTDQIHFDGELSGITLTGPNFVGNTGSISLAGLGTSLSGALVSLTTAGTGGFFNTPFSNAPTGVDGQILVPSPVPLPPAAMMGAAGIGGVLAIRRKRRS
jgi:hypothetical protein